MNGPKADKVEQMFDNISKDYDKLNHYLSLGIDKTWRRRALKQIVCKDSCQNILDVACGTGDFSIEIARNSCPGTKVHGLDLSEGMLAEMRRKVAIEGLEDRIDMVRGNCERLEFPDDSFDRVTIAFGIRNVENREKALREMYRVLKPGGKLVILELSMPSAPVIGALYRFYFLKVLPWIGGLVSGEKAAYRYLPASVVKFPGKEEWMQTMGECGFGSVTHKAFTLGICRMYVGSK